MGGEEEGGEKEGREKGKGKGKDGDWARERGHREKKTEEKGEREIEGERGKKAFHHLIIRSV